MLNLLPKLPQGALKIGEGRISAYLCFIFGLLSCLGVLAFMFPSNLTTPELRSAYEPSQMRALMATGLTVAAGFGCFALSQRAERRFAWAGLAMAAIAMALGGPDVAQGVITPGAFYIGLDWFIIGLISTGGVFILLEKLAPLRKDQPIFRENWLLDAKYFLFYHLLIGFFLVVGNYIVHNWFGWFIIPGLGETVRSLPFAVQFGLILLTIDLLQYWIHRLYHETDIFWRVHSVHHSAKTMDWLASSRLNFIEPLITRTVGLLALSVMGFGQGPINAYIIFVGFHATFIHANCGINLSWMEKVLVTPKYHHWHHAKDQEAVNKNYAVYLSFIDKLFGTQYCPDHWPEGYGIVDDEPPKTLLKQQIHPFIKKRAEA